MPGLDQFHASLKAKASGAKGWASRNVQVEYLGGNTFKSTISIGPQVVRHQATKEFVRHHYVENPIFASERNCRVFAQASNVAIELYDFYAKLFNPDYETVSVHDERFDVQYLFREQPEAWRSVDYYNPKIEITPLADGVDIKKTFDTGYGPETLEITYTVRAGRFLKHTIVFTNKTAEQKTFRVVMKLAGIASDKVKHGQTEERITEEKHIVAHTLIFGENDQNLKLTERLWNLGIENEDTLEWSPSTLKDIILDTHAQGSKADIIIGNYPLAENESLEIDPDSDTWQVSASTDDGWRSDLEFRSDHTKCFAGDHSTPNYFDYESGARFLNVDVPKDATISSAFHIILAVDQIGSNFQTRIYGEDNSHPATFSTKANFDGRTRTSAKVDWDNPTWSGWVSSPDIKTIIQEIVDRGDWESGHNLVIFWEDDLGVGYQHQARLKGTSYNTGAASAPKLEITWIGVVVPTVTTQAATGLTVGAGTLHGTITATGGANADERGFDWDYDSGAPYAYEETDVGSFGTGAFEEALTGLTQGNTVYFRGKAHNSAGWGYGGELNFVVRKAVTRSASAAMGMTGVSGRIKIAIRSASAALGMAGTPNRVLHAFRPASGALTIQGVSGRAFIGERSAAATLGMAGTAGRVLHAFRAASAALGIVGATDRVLHAVRSAGASISAVGTATRSWIGTRSASASIGITATAGRIKTAIRSASAALGLVAVASRSWVGTRIASAGISVTGTAVRSWIGSRAASAALGLAATASAVRVVTRTASAAIGMTGTAVRSWVGSRSAPATINIEGTADRSLIAERSASAAISMTGVADRIKTLIRTASASLGLTGVAGRAVVVSRSAPAAIGIVGTAARSWVGTRTAAASMAMTGVADRLLNRVRSAAASMSLAAVASRSAAYNRAASASISIQATPGRMLAAIRSASATITLTAIGIIGAGHIIGGSTTLKMAVKTRLLKIVSKEQTLKLTSKSAILDIADKIRKLKLGRKET